MIYVNTIIKVADNSGAKFVKCINNGHGRKRSAGLNDMLKVLVYKKDSKKLIKRKTVYNAIVINCRRSRVRKNGIRMKWRRNRVLMVGTNLKFLGTRVYGPICKEMKNKVKKKEGTFRGSIVSYAKGSA
jgi:large subunit ribosomal protein L14